MNLVNVRALRQALLLSGCCSFLAVLGSGCGKSEKTSGKGTGIIVGASSKTIAEMAPADVIVSVDGVPLTKRAHEEILDRMEATFRAANAKGSIAELKSFRSMKERTLVDEFVVKEVLLQEARRRGLKASAEDVAAVGEALGRRAKLEGKTPEKYLQSMEPASADRIRRELAEQALIRALRRAQFGDRLQITDADLQETRARIARYNQMCEATNALVKARAESVCARLKSGEDFAAVSREVSEDRKTAEKGGLWGDFSRAEIEDKALREAAFSLPVGAVSEPFDTEEGLVIIKVLGRSGNDSLAAASSATVKLGRIFLQLGEFRQAPDDSQLRKELEVRRLEELQRDFIPALIAKSRVEFPNGRTNLLAKAKSR